MSCRTFLPERIFQNRRKANPNAGCSAIKQEGVGVISGNVILELEQYLVAGRGGPRSPARQAGPTVGPFCRKGLSPQGEPERGLQCDEAGRRERNLRQRDFGIGTIFGRRSRRAAKSCPAGRTYYGEVSF